MSTATVTSKGQITVPKDVREDLGLTPGAKVLFVKVAEGHYRLLARTGDLAALEGILHRPGQRPLTLAEMEEGIASGALSSGTQTEVGTES